MDLACNVSAIDDSYGTIHLGPSRLQSGPARGGSPLTQEHLGYIGPRSGHWTVKDSGFASGVDDGTPTVWQLPNARCGTQGGLGGLKRLNGDVSRRLARATEDQRKAEQAVDATAEIAKYGGEERAQASIQAARKPQIPKGFFVPKTDLRGIRIAGKNGKVEVVRAPQIAQAPSVIQAAKPSANSEKAQEVQANASSPEPDMKVKKAASVVSHVSQRSQRTIRIAGKNGEKAFMSIPFIRPASKSASSGPSFTKPKEATGNIVPATQDNKADKVKRDANVAKVAKALRDERVRQEESQEQEIRAKLAAKEILMSGALPAPSAKSPSARISTKSSSKRSKEPSAHSVSKSSSVPPLSAASSKTSVAPQSLQAGSKKSSSRSSQSVRSASSRYTEASRKDNDADAEFKPSSKSQWRKIGSGTLDAPSPKQWPSASGGNTPIHSFRGSARSNNERTSSQSDSHHSSTRSSRISRHSRHPSPPPGETIFAGRGWISPHPLSVAPSEHQEPPDPLIKLGSRGGGTLTYEEWKAMRKTRRNNFSRSSSDAEEYGGGSWGYRKVSVGERRESGSVSNGWEQEGRSYRSPRVESVVSGGGTYEHNFDGARDKEGRVQLPMPWDDDRVW